MGDNNESAVENIDLPKIPFKRLSHALNQVVNVAIPLHVSILKGQTEALQTLKDENREQEQYLIQVKASKTVQLLKADLYELENLNLQVRDEDQELFNKKILTPTKNVIEILTLFMELHSDVLAPFPETEVNDSNSDIPPLICKYDVLDETDESVSSNVDMQVQEQAILTSKRKYYEAWSFLQKELFEINSIIKQFASLVFSQKNKVDTIQDNIEQTNDNVSIGAKYLVKASGYKAATFPIAGAVIGGLILGPAGALAGFKLVGSIACLASGGVLGFGAGLKLKQKQQRSCDIEMKALTYPSKSKSQSTPDISSIAKMD